MTANLRNALIFSMAIHAVIFLPPLGFIRFPEWQTDRREVVTVDYVVIKEPPVIEEIKRIEFRLADAPKETPRIELKSDVDIKPAGPPRANTEDRTPEKTAADKVRNEQARKSAEETARRQASIKSTREYTDYYRLMREKIRQRLKANYAKYLMEAEVHTVFALNSDGSLENLQIEKTGSVADKALMDITITSIRQASPFRPFPKALSLPKMSFNLVVAFKKQ